MPKPHWLAPSGKTKTPAVVVSFDTETTATENGPMEEQRLRCWDAIVRVRDDDEGRRPDTVALGGESPAELADVIETAAAITGEAWAIAHNVGFDLTVSSLPFVLSARGWHTEALHLGDESSWWILKRTGHKIVITDSWSWLRCSLETAAKEIGRRKVPLPANDAPLAEWHKRCRRDVILLDELMCQLMDWWERADLGSFGITGASCGWRAMRRFIRPKAILVGPDEDRTPFERRAIFGGRKQVWGVGQFKGTWIGDYDFADAYLTTAAYYPLPSMPCTAPRDFDGDYVGWHGNGRDYIAEVEITTHTPCAPCRIGEDVWWTVGTFRTVLSGPELRFAAGIADRVKVIKAEWYKVRHDLAEWAAWCLTVKADFSPDIPPVARRVAKAWGRSVTGKFAARTSRVISQRPATHLGWHITTGHDLDTGIELEYLSMGGVELTIAKDQDGGDCFPAVLAFIEGHTRVALGTMIGKRPPKHLLQCNTDGWWEKSAVRDKHYVPDGSPEPYRLVSKAVENTITVIGPNHVSTPSERRFAGIPSGATTNTRGALAWRDWPGLRWQLENSSAGTYTRPPRETVLQEHYCRSWVLTTGETIPATTRLSVDGVNVLEPWSTAWGRLDGDKLSPIQVTSLRDLADTASGEGLFGSEWLPTQPGRGVVISKIPERRPNKGKPLADRRMRSNHFTRS